MAKAVINLQKESGGITKISSTDGTGVTELVVPESGNLVSVDTAVTDNAIARYDGTTGKLQDSGVFIDDSGNVGIGATPSAWYPGNTALETGTYSALYQGQGGEQNLESNSYRNGSTTWVYKSSGNGASRYINNFGEYSWYIAPVGIAGSLIAWTNAMTLYANGNLLLQSGTGALGYGAGAGGTVTQLTSKSTVVTLNKPSGKIITHSAALAGGETVIFALINSLITETDSVYCTILSSGANSAIYRVVTSYGNNGYCKILLTNISTSMLSDIVTIKFEVIKGAIA